VWQYQEIEETAAPQVGGSPFQNVTKQGRQKFCCQMAPGCHERNTPAAGEAFLFVVVAVKLDDIDVVDCKIKWEKWQLRYRLADIGLSKALAELRRFSREMKATQEASRQLKCGNAKTLGREASAAVAHCGHARRRNAAQQLEWLWLLHFRITREARRLTWRLVTKIRRYSTVNVPAPLEYFFPPSELIVAHFSLSNFSHILLPLMLHVPW
jgi:hypothetical protein